MLNEMDKRNAILVKEIQKTQSWISSVEHMFKWMLDFFFWKSKVKKFMKYVDVKKKDIEEKQRIENLLKYNGADKESTITKTASKKGA